MEVSNVTDVVFVAHRNAAAQRFIDLVEEFYMRRYGREIEVVPLENNGPNVGFCQFFYLGLDYADDILLNALKAEEWVGHSMLWIEDECWSGPNIQVNGETILKGNWEF